MRVIVVGGGAAGASCAARLRRLNEDAEIIILEKTDEISIANCGLPYFCSDVINDRTKMLVSNPSVFKNLLNVEVRLNSAVTSINKEKKSITVNNEYELEYDKLVLALGASPIKPPIVGIDNKKIFTVRTLFDADRIKDFVKQNDVKNAVVIGGGFIGCEMAENFVHLGLNTSIVELSNQLLAPIDTDMAAFVHNHMRDNSVNLILSDGVKEFEESEIVLNSGKKILYDIAILAIGVKPEIELAKEAGLQIGVRGLYVNEFMQTSDKHIYAAGDSVEVKDFVDGLTTLIPLAGPANRQGRIIADNISGLDSKYKNTQGTAVVKIFDQTVANTGNNEKQLIAKEVEYKKIHILGNSHATYYPGSFPMFIKLLFTKEGKILGAQAVGLDGVEKRIDVIATIMRLGGKIQDLIDSELCYAPPYSSAKDPVNLLGMAADNILKDLVKPVYSDNLEDVFLVDVRNAQEFELKTIEGAKNISVEEIRKNPNIIPKDRKVVLFCNRGFQSYVASRILIQKGFTNVFSLSGGFSFYKEQTKNKAGIVCNNLEKNEKVFAMNNTKILKLDACGMQCPGPILKIANEIKNIETGSSIEITTTDAGFSADIKSWCDSTGNTLLNLTKEDKIIKALIQKGNAVVADSKGNIQNGQTIVVFSDDFDKVMASFIIANGAAASGKPVTMFFTFWGLSALKKANYKAKDKSIIEKMFDFMLPSNADKLSLSKMNMGGLGSIMMKMIMKNKNISSLQELMKSAQENGVKFIACSMSMDVMGVKKDEFIDGVEIGGVAKYIAESNYANSNLFI